MINFMIKDSFQKTKHYTVEIGLAYKAVGLDLHSFA